MLTYDVFYSLKPQFHNPPVRTVKTITATHRYVFTIDGEDLEDAYKNMQAVNWNPSKTDIDYLREVEIHHASMSIDDVFHCFETDKWFQVVDVGFREIV